MHFRGRLVRVEACILNGSGVEVTAFNVAPVPPKPQFVSCPFVKRQMYRQTHAGRKAYMCALPAGVFFSVVSVMKTSMLLPNRSWMPWVQAGTLDFLCRLSDVLLAIEACGLFLLPCPATAKQ